jgi:predicted deacylase
MTSETHGLDRRDFMLMAAAGATALASSTVSAAAQTETAKVGGKGTVFTGDIIGGNKVISALNVEDLEPGRHHLYFEGVQRVGGQHWYVSVVVVKGAKPGKRIALISGVHGDEISPIRMIQAVLDQLDPKTMAGTVLAVLDVSGAALEGMARRWPNSDRGIDLVDINREWPGNERGPNAASRHAWLVFNKLLKPNADYAIDFHTATTGMDMSAFHLAKMDIPEVKAMAELYPIDHIFDDAAYPTLLANAFIAEGIPAFTPEIGAPRILDRNKIDLFVEGTMNVLKLHGLIDGPMGRTGKDSGVFVANSMGAVIASHGGFVELLVELNEKVEVGQKVAVQRNAFGDVLVEYQSPVAGEVGARRTDATAEPGSPLLFFLFKAPVATDEAEYPE